MFRRGITEPEVSEAYLRYGHLVLRRCQRILRDHGAAEDALQEVFLRLWKYGEAFQEAESKLSWLYRVANRCCFDRLSQCSRRAEVSLGDEDGQRLVWNGKMKAVEDWDLIVRVLDRLDDRLQQIAVMRFLDEMTQEEIAAATGWSRQTIVKKLALLQAHAERVKGKLCGEERKS